MTVLHDSGIFFRAIRAWTYECSTAPAGDRPLARVWKKARLGSHGHRVRHGSDSREIFDIFRFAAQQKTTVYVHTRSSGPVEPGAVDSVRKCSPMPGQRSVAAHRPPASTALREMDVCLEMIARCQEAGSRRDH